MQSFKQLRDRELQSLLLDTIQHDSRVCQLKLSINVKGAVAHVRGSVFSEKERQLARNILRRQNGLYAVWDLITLPKEKLTIVDIGCGEKKQVPEAIGIDQYPGSGVDIVTNLEKRLPFGDNAIDHIFAINILEHMHDLLRLMNDLHRVLRPTGVLHVIVPNSKDVVAVADPTHVRFFDPQTFKYFCEPKPGVEPWKPLMISVSKDTVYADLSPINNNEISEKVVARWFV